MKKEGTKYWHQPIIETEGDKKMEKKLQKICITFICMFCLAIVGPAMACPPEDPGCQPTPPIQPTLESEVNTEGQAVVYVEDSEQRPNSGHEAVGYANGEYDISGFRNAAGNSHASADVNGGEMNYGNTRTTWSNSYVSSSSEKEAGRTNRLFIEGYAAQGNWNVSDEGGGNFAGGGNVTYGSYEGEQKGNCGPDSISGNANANGVTSTSVDKSQPNRVTSIAVTYGNAEADMNGAKGPLEVGGSGGTETQTVLQDGPNAAVANNTADFMFIQTGPGPGGIGQQGCSYGISDVEIHETPNGVSARASSRSGASTAPLPGAPPQP